MRALDRKLLRDLSRMLGQVITIGLVVACGVAAYVSIQGTYRSLLSARDSYYERYRFADVFVHLQRAPEAVAARLAQLPGVARVETRVVESVRIPIAACASRRSAASCRCRADGKPSLGARDAAPGPHVRERAAATKPSCSRRSRTRTSCASARSCRS